MDEEPHEFLKNLRIHERKLREIDQLIEFIGGFKYWTLLNKDCQNEVVKFLDYNARCSLGLCSKADYQTVKKLPICVKLMTISEAYACKHTYTSIEKIDKIEVSTDFDYKSNGKTNITRVFSQQGEDTHVFMHCCMSKTRRHEETLLKSTNYYNAAVNYVEKCMQKCNYKLDKLKVQMTGNRFTRSGIQQLAFCKSAEFAINNVATLNWWLRKLPEKIEDLFVYTFPDRHIFCRERRLTIPTNQLDLPQIKQVSNFDLECNAQFTDKQFLNLEADSMVFFDPNISSNCVNTFLKKWANGERDFREVRLRDLKNIDSATILYGLDSRPWNDEFRAEFAALCEKFRERWHRRVIIFQIKSFVDPFESVTLLIDNDVQLLKTGHKTTKEGKTYTRWYVPKSMFDFDEG